MLVAPTATDDLKVGDIFQSKVELLRTINEWSIEHGVSFMLAKANKTCYRAICATIVEGDNIGKMCALGYYMPLLPRVQLATSKLNLMYESIYIPNLHSDPITVQQPQIFVCNVILPELRKKLDISPSYIINIVENKYHINIAYKKTWNTRTKALTKIFGD